MPLRFCSGNFALRKPSWGLPDFGGVQALSDDCPDFSAVEPPAAEGLARPVGCWIKGAGGTWKRMRLTKKTDGSLVRRCDVPHVFHGVRWKRLRFCDEALGFLGLMMTRGDVFHRMSEFLFPGKALGDVPWLLHSPASPGFCLIRG